MGTTPTWLAPMVQNIQTQSTLEEIQLNSGSATLLQELGDDGAVKRVTIPWSVPGRVFLLSGKLTRELAVAISNAVQ
jgi:hypothetical protein